MSQKTFDIPGIGPVILAKRRGARNLRLSVTAGGTVRVSMPSWLPYRTGVEFARTRTEWIQQHRPSNESKLLISGHRVGKAHRLEFIQAAGKNTAARITPSTIKIASALEWDHPEVQSKARLAGERALKQEADNLLPQRLEYLAKKFGYSYRSVQSKKLTSRWGSCSSEQRITLSYFLMQLPWELIDYVLIHELIHTEHMNHGPEFWAAFERALPDAKAKRREARIHHPRLSAQV